MFEQSVATSLQVQVRIQKVETGRQTIWRYGATPLFKLLRIVQH